MAKLVSLKAVETGQPFELSHQKEVSPALKCAVVLEMAHICFWYMTAKPYNKLESWYDKQFLDSFPILQFMICKGKGDFENFFFFLISNIMSSVNNNYLYAKFASALATLMWHFMMIAMEEVDEDVFGF